MSRHMTGDPIDSITTPAIDKLRAQGVYPDAPQEWHSAQGYALNLTPREIVKYSVWRAASASHTLGGIVKNLSRRDARWVLQDLVYEITE